MALFDRLIAAATIRRLVIVALICGGIRYGVMPRIGAELLTTPGAGPLDLMFAYTPAEAFANIGAFSDTARSSYRMFLVTADIAYPISYTLLFVWAIALVIRTTRLEHARWPFAPPLLLFGFDIMENAAVFTLLSLHPDQPVALAWLASIFTTLKWSFAGVTMLVLVYALGLRLVKQGTPPETR